MFENQSNLAYPKSSIFSHVSAPQSTAAMVMKMILSNGCIFFCQFLGLSWCKNRIKSLAS
jgi:hypothetical protein